MRAGLRDIAKRPHSYTGSIHKCKFVQCAKLCQPLDYMMCFANKELFRLAGFSVGEHMRIQSPSYQRADR